MRIGIDIAEIKRFRKISLNSRFYKNVFTNREIEYCKSKKDYYRHFAARFAAKEAVKKAVNSRLGFKEIEIMNRKDGSPYINFTSTKRYNKYKIDLSLSHSESIAVAVCVTPANFNF